MGDKREEYPFNPRTALGQRLWNIRARIAASGEPLLTWDDIDRELAERRGERGKSNEPIHRATKVQEDQ
jgi:hypothetical protein